MAGQDIRAELDKLMRDIPSPDVAPQKALERKLRVNDEAVCNLTRAVERGFDAAVAARRLDELTAERLELEKEKAELVAGANAIMDREAVVKGALELLDEFEDVMATAPLPKQKALLRCFVAGARANSTERRVEVSFYQVPFHRDPESCVPYIAMPEVRVAPTRSHGS